MIAPVQVLTEAEYRHLINAAYEDSFAEDGPRLREAQLFYDEWLHHAAKSVESMIWALNNEALTYRLHLISILVAMRLHN